MVMGEEQTQRLMELLGKLAVRDAGEPVPMTMETMLSAASNFGGQEHNDAKTLTHMGWIRPKHSFVDVSNSWSGEGIYAFDLTDDGRAALAGWEERQLVNVADESDVSERVVGRRPLVMMIHGSSDGRVPQVVDTIRMWCFENGLDAYKAADLPNVGRFVNDKIDDIIDGADYYIVVLTADEQLTTGALRPRPNTLAEMGRVLDRDRSKVCVLVESGVDIPSDYAGHIREPLDRWKSVLTRELRAVGLM